MAQRSRAKAYVLDTWAVMAYLEDEKAGDSVESLIIEANENRVPLLMSVANIAEVWYLMARESTPEQANQALTELRQLGVEIWDITLELALLAAKLKSQHRLSLGDCFAAALALQNKAVLVTGDREFKQVEGVIRLFWLRGDQT